MPSGGATGGAGRATDRAGRGKRIPNQGSESLEGGLAVAQLRSLLGDRDGDRAGDESTTEAGQQDGTLLVGERE